MARLRAVGIGTLLLCSVGLVAGPQPRLPAFKTSIDLTTVNATVVDANGALVKGLPQDAFEVFEDGVRQTIAQFTNERVPVSVGILVDVSDSMFGRRLQDAREAVDRFVGGLLAREDEFALVAFNHRQQVLSTWTHDATIIPRAMATLIPQGSTAIYDAIVATLPLVEVRANQRAALLVISDGGDTASDRTSREVRSASLRSDAFVYAVAIDPPERRPLNRPVNPQVLVDVTDPTGGRTKIVHSSSELGMALQEIADELNSQYLIGYTSPTGADGQYHTIRVRVPNRDVRVRARRGYVADPRN